MRILVVGGAGYVGSHTVRLLIEQGHSVWVYDNLSTGHRQAVDPERLIEGDLADRARMTSVLGDLRIEAVMHFAALALVGESVTQPARYYENNVVGSFNLLEAMRATDVHRIVFSSTAATYGTPDRMPISEDAPQKPINPYGVTKLSVEQMLDAYADAYEFAPASLRYFNAAGATPTAEIGEDHTPESHLIPLVLQVALGQRESITIFGTDYPTPDGSCVRDYIHVDDLGTAHLAALERLRPGQHIKLNLGTGEGVSVREVINACAKITGHEIATVEGARRPGDPPVLVADSSRAKKELNWDPLYPKIEDIAATAWNWHLTHPTGYAT